MTEAEVGQKRKATLAETALADLYMPSNIFRGYKRNAQHLYQNHPQLKIIEEGFDIAIRFAEAMEMGGMNAEIEAAGERLKRLLPILVAQEEEFEVEVE